MINPSPDIPDRPLILLVPGAFSRLALIHSVVIPAGTGMTAAEGGRRAF